MYRTADWLNVVFLFNSAVGFGDESSPSAMTDVFRISSGPVRLEVYKPG